jgi:hypothetical protein
MLTLSDVQDLRVAGLSAQERIHCFVSRQINYVVLSYEYIFDQGPHIFVRARGLGGPDSILCTCLKFIISA